MKPDRCGQWHSRDGQEIVVWRQNGSLWYRFASDDRDGRRLLEYLEGDDWLPAIAPTFPELPPKPEILVGECGRVAVKSRIGAGYTIIDPGTTCASYTPRLDGGPWHYVHGPRLAS